MSLGKYGHYVLLSVVFLLSVVVWTEKISVGGFSWSDAPIHAMDGVFVYDFARAVIGGQVHLSNFANVKEWAYQYYGKYPSLGIVVFYPPMFAAIESLVYGAVGISVLASRLTVVLLGSVGFWAFYFVGRKLYDKWIAVLMAGIWASLPATVLWGRMVMLEVPTVAMILVTVLFYLNYKENERYVWLILAGMGVVGSFLMKQWAIFISVVLASDMIMTFGVKKVFVRRNVVLGVIVAGMILAYMMFSSGYAELSKMLVRGDNWRHLFRVETWLFYVKVLPNVLGVPLLVVSVAGVLVSLVSGRFGLIRIAAMWAVIFYLFATVIAYKEQRYLYLIVPAFVWFACGGLAVGLSDTKLSKVGKWILVGVFAVQAYGGLINGPVRLNDYSRAAKLVTNKSDTNVVLVDGAREGQFVFDMRKVQGVNGRMYVVRGSKLLYSRAARRRWKYKEYVRNERDILKLIKKYGIRYIVVESAAANVPDWQDYFPPPSQKLRKLLSNRRLFVKVDEFPVCDDKNNKVWADVKLQVFKYKGKIRSGVNEIVIPVPAMGRDIKIHTKP